MDRRTAIKMLGTAIPALYLSKFSHGQGKNWTKVPFRPTWDSLEQYRVPAWFRDAKFGIWAHWGPQCQPERGDWYARGMYEEGSDQYNYHIATYGHPSKFGFKDVINEWKATQWDAEKLMDLYARTGAQYFMALANHHDNLDLYNSSHHAWNSMHVGPKRDIVGGWERAAKKRGLRFGVSVHAAHAWTWYETAQRSDKNGPLKGVPYDGRQQKADGNGQWWQGLDPQELYAQNHPLSKDSEDGHSIHKQWHWDVQSGVNVPTPAYCDNFKARTIELIDNYRPDIVYFDDTALPLWPISDVGLEIAAHYYNENQKWNKGELTAVINGKILNEQQRKCMVWDIERGQSNRIEPEPWQTCTCIGAWHYDRRIYDNDHYKSAKTVIHMLVDVVSKNGNLLLSVPLRGDGSLDDKARKVVEGIADWMQINAEAIIGTRPWFIFGEGPAQEEAPALEAQGFNEGKGKPFTAQDIRFTTKGSVLFATVLGVPNQKTIIIKSLGKASAKRYQRQQIANIQLLGSTDPLSFVQHADYLEVHLPENTESNAIGMVLRIS
ncbi:alpha-L-fucosidase [Sphingobacterium oryzagri]|uniref:alpha-L-fucosidase n=1 Tax=Sphingobacterium oryzagri TaxID=3025669 RepID=A0ABY7WB25_9SPHI|nr:alpha-L-fucosidase [Sphingobacterium sp. KACC 22765]WDF66844.1 alpha-L-fucosidase [Sphingobacterium sp. KACC 22765]